MIFCIDCKKFWRDIYEVEFIAPLGTPVPPGIPVPAGDYDVE